MKQYQGLRDFYRVIQKKVGNYGVLTLTIVMMMLARPLFELDGEGGGLTDFFFLIIFLSGVFAARKREFNYALASTLGLLAFIARLHSYLIDHPLVPLIISGTTALFFLGILFNLGQEIWNQRHRVNGEVIFAAICAYLIIGMTWCYFYEFIELAAPGSLKGPTAPLTKEDFYYFSFVSLSTLGFGDIVPVSRFTRSVAVIEAVTGQLYLAILISRLVSAHVSEIQNKEAETPSRQEIEKTVKAP